MPTVFRHNGYRFFFYSNEGDPREPVHVHVMKDDGEAKFWLAPEVRLARSSGFDARTLRNLARVVSDLPQRSKRPGMNISAERVRFDDDTMWLDLSDGRILGVPLAWFPRLLNASPEDRSSVTLSAFGLHWEVLDEDISISALLAGEHGTTKAA